MTIGEPRVEREIRINTKNKEIEIGNKNIEIDNKKLEIECKKEIIEKKEDKIHQQKKEIIRFEELLVTDGLYTVSDAAKILNSIEWIDRYHQMGEKRLFKFLFDIGWVFKKKISHSRHHYKPLQKVIEAGCMKTKIKIAIKASGEEFSYNLLFLTPKGILKIKDIIKSRIHEKEELTLF